MRLFPDRDYQIPSSGLFFDPAVPDVAVEPESFGHIHVPEFRDINRMTGDRKLVIVQPKAADLFAALASPLKLRFRLRIRAFGLVIGIDRLTKISDRDFSGAFRHLANKREFSLDPCPELNFDLVPIDLQSGGFTSLVLIQGPVPGEAGDAGSAIELSFLFRCRIEPDFMSLDHLWWPVEYVVTVSTYCDVFL